MAAKQIKRRGAIKRSEPPKTAQEQQRRPQRTFESAASSADMLAFNQPDPYVGIPEVIGLDESLFFDYLSRKDFAMVFFYKPSGEGMAEASEQLRQAAKTTKRENHGYAALNCDNNEAFCREFLLFSFSLPAFQLFSYGRFVNRFERKLTADEIKNYVETVPIPDEPPVDPSWCERNL